jgi:sugar lactone lactonase YvrE
MDLHMVECGARSTTVSSLCYLLDGIALDARHHCLYVTDTANHAIRRVLLSNGEDYPLAACLQCFVAFHVINVLVF